MRSLRIVGLGVVVAALGLGAAQAGANRRGSNGVITYGRTTTALAGEVRLSATSVRGEWSDPIGACVGHIVRFDPATGDTVCTGGSTWTGTWKGTTTWTLTGNQDPATHAVSGRIDETFTGRAADGRTGTLAFVERLSIDPTGKTDITGHIVRSCGALAGSLGRARWIGTSAADGSGSGTYSGQWKEGRRFKRCRAPRPALAGPGHAMPREKPAIVRTPEPRITVPMPRLRSALVCQHSVVRATRTPVLLLPPTGSDGSELYRHGLQVSLTRAGIPSCYVNFPAHTTGDLQLNVQYVVYAIRTIYRRAGREIAAYGLSQGALLPRFALIYWPSLRRMVSDAVLVSGDQYGTLLFSAWIAAVCRLPGCRFPASIWQQAAGSNLLRAINRPGRDPTPGPTAWTTVHSLTDEVALPATGPHPTAVLPGASNLVIQNICPGRQDLHTATAFDSVSYAALIDAITHPGPARSARISRSVCRRLYAPGLDPQRTTALIAQINAAADQRSLPSAFIPPLFSGEPPVARWVLRG